ncbi:Oidioi.mRNA.OKI2018_I69.chr1.g1156.t1.cds [Oikopleura dioica]|uniref:Oidioi.mRNA.OKI2018_I69.chr1.g1156.t1.cds n=1 Tax=Oikopleura dioica TaxID=34765 RepID=A0ABN7SQN0_OIKDI|nr:Oidioi.mRNA.OKI2018_I69.chr1.g1156.t1.cds [Oikopleura dioica]
MSSSVVPHVPELNEDQLASLKDKIQERLEVQSCEDGIRRACMCKYHKYSEEEEILLERETGQTKVELAACSHAVYTPGITNSGIILLCDPMNTELMGSRLMMQQLQEAGHHVIKPNLFQSPDLHIDFMNAIASYFGRSEGIKNIPKPVDLSRRFLLNQGCATISLIGICWGGCLVQEILATDDSYAGGISIDGLFYQKDFAALSPSLFLIGNDKIRTDQHLMMKNVMWNNNVYPWEVILHDFPLVHGWFAKIFACQEHGMSENIEVCTNRQKEFANMCAHAKATANDCMGKILDFLAQFANEAPVVFSGSKSTSARTHNFSPNRMSPNSTGLNSPFSSNLSQDSF